jgi:hypothetical protein
MNLSEESRNIRDALGEFLNELAFVGRRWIRIDSCSNNTFQKPVAGGETKEFECPLESLSDLLGISANKANEYLCAAKLLVPHNKYPKTMGINKNGWDALKSEYHLDIDLEQTSSQHLGKRMHVMRIGCLCDDNNNTTFSAVQQAKSFFEKESWKPKRLRPTSQATDFLSKASLDLTIIMAKQQKELDEKEKQQKELNEKEKQQKELDEKERNDEILALKSAKPVQFDMKDACTEPIRWQSPNGKKQTAVRIPRTGTRLSFRKTALQTRWIEQVTESMLDKEKVLPEVGVEWLIESLYERHRPQFESFCERKGYLLPTKAPRRRKRKKEESL